MSAQLNPYLNFGESNARDAMVFYQSIFGGTLVINTYGESQMPHGADEDNKVMHAQLTGDNGIVFMASDVPDHVDYFTPGNTINMSLSGDDESLLRGYFDKLSEGGTVGMPLTKAEWGDTFGMVTDKFGINWMVNISGPAKNE